MPGSKRNRAKSTPVWAERSGWGEVAGFSLSDGAVPAAARTRFRPSCGPGHGNQDGGFQVCDRCAAVVRCSVHGQYNTSKHYDHNHAWVMVYGGSQFR